MDSQFLIPGSSFDDFLKEDGTYEDCQAAALKRVVAWRLRRLVEFLDYCQPEDNKNDEMFLRKLEIWLSNIFPQERAR